jgi:hypothetical protein
MGGLGRFAGAALAAALLLPAGAAAFADGQSGLAVNPPAPFVVSPAKSKSYDVAVVINSLSGSPSLGAGDYYLCQVGFKGVPENADLAQEEINIQVSQPEWLDNAAEALSQSFDISAKSTFVLHGATGIELVGKPKDASHAAGLFISMIDTPMGRTTLNCATRPEELDKAVNQFRLIRAGITPPGTKP